MGWILIMVKIKRAVSAKETKLLDIISTAKRKLAALQEKQILALGALACQHGLHEFDSQVLDKAFKWLSMELTNK